MFKEWLEILKLIPENNCSARKFICPECGNESIEYIYILEVQSHILDTFLFGVQAVIKEYKLAELKYQTRLR